MNKSMKLLASASAIAAVMAASPAFAAQGETEAGTTVTNNVSVSFAVNGTTQTPQTAKAEFKVDRKVAFTVVESNTEDTAVTPGQTGRATTFTVTNTTNGALSVKLEATNTATAKRETDTFNVTNFSYYRDHESGVAGIYDPGIDTLITNDLLVGIPEDGSVFVHVVADIPVTKAADTNLVNNDVAAILLTGTAYKDDNSGPLEQSVTNTILGVDNVFAEAADDSGAARNGVAGDKDGYKVVTADIRAAKTSRAISDPINNTTNPKMIPGAIVEYCIAVTNAGTVSASNIAISDPIPDNTEFVAGSIYKDQTVADGVCSGESALQAVTDAVGYDTSSSKAKVLVTLTAALAENQTRGVRFRVQVK